MPKKIDENTFKAWKELILKAQNGDKNSCDQFLSECYDFIENIVFNKLWGKADFQDVTQECMIGIYKSLGTFDIERSLRPWLFGIVRFKVIDFIKKCEKSDIEETFFDFEDVTNGPELEKSILDKEEMAILYKLIDQLPEKLKKAFIAIKIEGKEYKDVAFLEKTTETTLRKRTSRAVKVISNLYIEKLEEEFEPR